MTDDDPNHSDATRAVSAGRDPARQDGAVNPPVMRASTILAPTFDALKAQRRVVSGENYSYGRHGVRGTFALEEAIQALEGGGRTRLAPSGVAAISAALISVLGAGEHLLMTDGCYGPTRATCDGLLKRMGVETTYFDPLIGPEISGLFRPNTKALFLESPTSWTFEISDIRALAAAARAHGAVSLIDATWASPLRLKPLALGVDISIHSVTKYVAGHSDVMMGAVTAREEVYPRLRTGWRQLGLAVGPDDAALALRGLRSLAVRQDRQAQTALILADWLAARPEVAEVLHPARPADPGHALFKRDFLGSSGLFGFLLPPERASDAHLSAFLDELSLFGMGASWGGFESLLIPNEPPLTRAASPWPRPGRPAGQLMRVSCGLEEPCDLIRDLEAAFARLAAA